MTALLVLGLALPIFALVAYGVVATEGYRENMVTGHQRTRTTQPRRFTAATITRVGWLTLAQTVALLAGLILRLLVHH